MSGATNGTKALMQQSAWKTLVPVPAGAIHEHSTIALSSTQLVIIDGVLQTGAVLDSVYLYDIPKNAWKKLAPLPVAINHANAAAVDGKIFVLGGMTGASWAGWVTARARMPAPRRGFATGMIGTKIYMFGSEGNPDPASKGVFG
ncbi:hypothetical protein B0T26DRAFT_751008 [Lasiosphaeria miniovina]|uniref:Galactose oxidase n=1 Tax=Lasiosphaeria miniovina TaxID=1954250 RepID=A0AA40AJ73_9PEZI|nr:uncharacterized protein B0T26DRAFT_751008 [Lasiosphaeria miniovina]KAK0716861.1 hypothetical protein B0T26DRAFT_751008 [Lasiosphaeria miniovina]